MGRLNIENSPFGIVLLLTKLKYNAQRAVFIRATTKKPVNVARQLAYICEEINALLLMERILGEGGEIVKNQL
ncbi:MAG TPA: hypothetical protein G4N96_10740 [Chloroflexi bacterium]|nr:hypothetical protein [Chloroflexota bacterium]